MVLNRQYIHLTGFNLGEIQNVVDYAKQGITGALDISRILKDLLILALPEDHFIHAKNCINRRSDLMGHVGQK